TINENILIPNDTSRISILNNSGAEGYMRIFEIISANERAFTATNGYMLLHAYPTKVIKTPYQMVTINYFPTSVQKLYKIGTTGEWLQYQDKEILVKQGETIYAKGVDQYGNETRIVSSYTMNVTNAI